jgi:hypothetical protein
MSLARYTVVRFHRRVENTRTKPSLVFCEDENGEEAEFYLKLRSGSERATTGLVCEIMAAQFATDLDLPTPESGLLEVTAEFAKTVPNPEVTEQLSRSVGWNFGARKAGSGYSAVLAGRVPPSELLHTAAEIFAFDGFIQNPDRRTTNPNLLSNGSGYVMIDHELAFDFIDGMVLGWTPPWEGGVLNFLRTHVFYDLLRQTAPDYNRLAGAIEALSTTRLEAYADAVPAEWAGGRDAATKILDYLLLLKTNIPATLDAIQGMLK